MSDKPSYYAILTADVRYDKNLKSSEKLLYAEITALTNAKGKCFASNGYFAELYNVSKTSVSNWVSNLAKQGYIKTEFIYKKNSKEIESRFIKITNTPLKENCKDNINNNKHPQDLIFDSKNISNKQFLDITLKDQYYLEVMAMKTKSNIQTIEKYLKEFELHLVSISTNKDTLKQFKEHFNNWLNKQDIKVVVRDIHKFKY